MAITAAMVKELREMSGAGMMDCKKALTEADGDMDKAVEVLREKGLAKAVKKSGRIAAEGIVTLKVTEDGKNCPPGSSLFPGSPGQCGSSVSRDP